MVVQSERKKKKNKQGLLLKKIAKEAIGFGWLGQNV